MTYDKERFRKYYLENKERLLLKQREYYEKNREEIIEKANKREYEKYQEVKRNGEINTYG